METMKRSLRGLSEQNKGNNFNFTLISHRSMLHCHLCVWISVTFCLCLDLLPFLLKKKKTTTTVQITFRDIFVLSSAFFFFSTSFRSWSSSIFSRSWTVTLSLLQYKAFYRKRIIIVYACMSVFSFTWFEQW